MTVTPKVEGMLKLVGVRWKLSGSVVGFQIFGTDQEKKKIVNRTKAKQSYGMELTFLVIKVLTFWLFCLPFTCLSFCFSMLIYFFSLCRGLKVPFDPCLKNHILGSCSVLFWN